MIKAVFWDLGGTICRTDGGGRLLGAVRMAKAIKPFCGSYTRTFMSVAKMSSTYKRQRKLLKKELRLEELLKAVFGSSADLDKMAEAINAGALKYAAPMPGVHYAVSTVKDLNLPMAVVTDGFFGRDFVEGALMQLGLKEHFDKIIISCEVGSGKPRPEIFLTACREMNVTPKEVIYIGDKEDRDITGASAVGMKTVLVGKPPKKTKPDLHITNLKELPARLQHLF